MITIESFPLGTLNENISEGTTIDSSEKVNISILIYRKREQTSTLRLVITRKQSFY
jgi:hypothetical protein